MFSYYRSLVHCFAGWGGGRWGRGGGGGGVGRLWQRLYVGYPHFYQIHQKFWMELLNTSVDQLFCCNVFVRVASNFEDMFKLSFGFVWFAFYGPSTHFRSFRARSVNLETLFLGKKCFHDQVSTKECAGRGDQTRGRLHAKRTRFRSNRFPVK